MKAFETIVIFKNKKDIHEKVEEYQKLFTALSGYNILTDELGKKSLAYAIRKHKTGYYVIFTYKIDEPTGTTIAVIEKQLRTDDDVLKFMTIKIESDEKMDALERIQQTPESEQDDPDAQEDEPDMMDVLFGLATYDRKEKI